MDTINKQIFKSVFIFIWYIIVPMIPFYYLFGDLMLNGFWEHKEYLFITLAAIFNAVMDSIENEHINTTVFKDQPKNFWSKRDSWNKAKKFFGWKFDAWHIAKSTMVVCLIAAIVVYKPILSMGLDFLILGYWWNHVFNGFYNHAFKLNDYE